MTDRYGERWGIAGYAGLLSGVVWFAARGAWSAVPDWGEAAHPHRGREFFWLIALALLPLSHLVSFSLPLDSYSQPARYALVSLPILVGSLLAVRAGSRRWRDVGLAIRWSWRGILADLVVIGVGVGIGYLEYRERPSPPLVSSLALEPALVLACAALAVAACTEEIVFRGILQRAARDRLGDVLGIAVGAVIYAVALGVGRSPVELGQDVAVGFLFGWAVTVSRSLVGVSLGRTVAHICSLVLFPHLL